MRSSISLLLCGLLLTTSGCGLSTSTEPTMTKDITSTPVRTEVIAPYITAHNQSVVDNTLTIGPVTMSVDGWLVVYGSDGEKPGHILGYAYVPAGEHLHISIPIENNTYSGKVYIAPHYDNGVPEQFDFPGVDMPLEIDGVVPVTSFVVE